MLTCGAIKLSIVLFYRRLFSTARFKFWNTVLIVLVVCWTITFGVATLAACPKSFNANFGTLLDLGNYCIDTFADLIAMVVSDVAVDLVILAIPIPTVRG